MAVKRNRRGNLVLSARRGMPAIMANSGRVGTVATEIVDWFGYRVHDQSPEAADAALREHCPFINDRCTKNFTDGTVAGVCALKQATKPGVVCCPNRLYGNNWLALYDVAAAAFGPGLPLVPGGAAQSEANRRQAPVVAVFGKWWGGELHLPQRGGSGSYYVDYILALIDPTAGLDHFVAVEVQSIDTTGNYRTGWRQLMNGRQPYARNSAAFNWENVSKRILPQVIYKGNVLQQEQRCQKGLFFVTPKPVYDRIMKRLIGDGANLPTYPLSSGSITFVSYDPDWANTVDGRPAPLVQTNWLTTNTVQVAQAFIGVTNLPPAGSFENAIRAAL